MHKLTRPQSGPAELLVAKQAELVWEDFHGKQEVQLALTVMQDNRCAYCECALGMGEGHIEHFRRKNSEWFPSLMFEWSNLYYSCKRNGSCGCHKDRVLTKDQVDDLIDPCVDDPEHFLIFMDNGDVAPRNGLSDVDRRRAELTIDVFGLRHPDLIAERANEIKKYKWMVNAGLSADAIDAYLNASRVSQYITAVYNYFGKRVCDNLNME